MIGSFALVFWIQYLDKNYNKKSKFDKFKIPIITAALVGFIGEIYQKQEVSNNLNQEIFTDIPNF